MGGDICSVSEYSTPTRERYPRGEVSDHLPTYRSDGSPAYMTVFGKAEKPAHTKSNLK